MRLLFFIASIILYSCQKTTPKDDPIQETTDGIIKYWETTGNQEKLILSPTANIVFEGNTKLSNIIEVDSSIHYQQVEGFGYTLTEGSAFLIQQMETNARKKILQEIFGNNEADMGVSYIRISIGASDLSTSVYTYNDLPKGSVDYELQYFSLSKDTISLIPILQEIIKINPTIKIMASPWTAPAWMKDNQSSIGGTLLKNAYRTYASYFVKYLQEYKKRGITIDAITIQNEPQNPHNNPSMTLSAAESMDFIKNYLGPVFKENSIQTKIIIWDHNCDQPSYPLSILSDSAANSYIDGTAFHLYAGDITTLSYIHTMFPQKNIYFTEQWTSANGKFNEDLVWHMKNVIVGSMKNWSKIALEWNLANDINYGPHTIGGCSSCKGAFTIGSSDYSKNVSYYIIAHIARFVPPMSIRIESSEASSLSTVSFKRPDGKIALIVVNSSNQPVQFAIKFKSKYASTKIEGTSTTTFIW